MVDVRLLADLPDALDSAAANTFLYKTAGGMEFQTLEYSDIVGYPTTGIDSAGIISLIDANHLATRDSSSHLNVINYFDSGISSNIKADSAGTTLNIGNYSKPINNLYLDSSSTITIGSHSFSLANNGEVSFFGGSASSYGISSGSSSAVVIQNSNYTSFLLKTDSTQTDAQVDASSNAFTITEAGNVTSTAFTPYHPKGYSLQLDGNDYITPGFNDNFGTGDFTFECWAKTTVGGVIMAQYDGGSQAEAFEIGTADGIIRSHTDSGTEGAAGSKDLRDNLWHHLVWERQGGTYYYYADGVLQDSRANTENGQQSSGWYIGRFGTANTGYYTGELRDLKFTVGTAVYGGSAPSVPTELTVSGSETFVFATGLPYVKDLSTNGSSRTITNYGDPIFVSEGPYDHVAYSPSSHGGSVYLDGTGDYLKTPSDANFNLNSTDFTIEGWFYATAPAGNEHLWSSYIDTNNRESLYFSNSTTLNWWVNGSTRISTTIAADNWYHIALVDNSGTTTMYVNGVSKGTWTSTYTSGNRLVWLGTYSDGSYGPDSFTGYLSNWRFVKGTAVYTSAFTPPTQPLTAIANTQLLTCTNKHDIWDAAGGTRVTPVGDAAVSTSQTKFAASNIALDGTGDVVDFFAKDNEFVFGTKDFTIEFWMYPSAVGSENIIVDCRGGHTDAGFLIMLNSSVIKNLTSGAVRTTGGTTITSGSWYHVAVVRDSTSLRTYLNGTEESGSASYTSSITNPSGKLRLGAGFNDASYFNGYIEDLRVTNGLARYTANFTPATAALEA